MTTSATKNDPSSTTRSPTTLADAFPEDIVIQYIIKPTIGEHPILSTFVYLLLVGSYLWNCSAPSTAPFCNRTLDFAVIILLLVPVILMWYVIYKQRVFRRRSARQDGSV
ncbi:hypothetical protein SI65_08907 [Aspergillus cristatus]|uniref:Uncharacterized protein n=1 Tax=Aspergillus cristatus TaxID=573508 RepID=A0A1E3B3Z8_ASPCR|nr:hypothetical protein SI65_08907 [Aspergillus cristatus]